MLSGVRIPVGAGVLINGERGTLLSHEERNGAFTGRVLVRFTYSTGDKRTKTYHERDLTTCQAPRTDDGWVLTDAATTK